MIKHRLRIGGVIFALAAGMGGGCHRSASPGGDEAKPLKLAFVTNNTSEFWKIAAAGVHAYEKEANVHVDILQPPNGKVEEQNQMIENMGGAEVADLDAGHMAMISRAADLARILNHLGRPEPADLSSR